MRLQIFSDGHIDIAGNGWSPPAVDCDAVVVAGDFMAPMTLAITALRRALMNTGVPILYIPGNHCFYSDSSRPDYKTTYEDQLRRRSPSVRASSYWMMPSASSTA